MQGCAALEQKLRQCMDQPVRVGHRLRSTPSICSHHTARQGPEEEHYQLPPVENVPQDHRPSQAQLSKISVAAHATLYTICIPTARRDGRCASAHAGGVLSAITTLGRRSGEVGTVYICNLREGDKSTNHHLSITPLRSREVGRSATTLSGYHSMEARGVLVSLRSHTVSNNATMCDVLTRCSRPSHHLRLVHHQCLLLRS